MIPKFVSVKEMIAIEKAADASGHTYAQMMEFAGRGLAREIAQAPVELESQSVLAIVGKGNNGGDALVALDYLNQAGWRTTALIVSGRTKDVLVSRLEGKSKIFWTAEIQGEGLNHLISDHCVFVDGLLGTGIRLPLRGESKNLLAFVKEITADLQTKPYMVAVDCPSGLDCDSGAVAPETIPADLTVCMAAVKRGMLRLPAFGYLGTLRVATIGLPDSIGAYEQINRFVINGDWVANSLPDRPLDAHKGTFGKALIIAGSRNYIGAVLLSGRAAFRAGAGWVTLAVPEQIQAGLAGHFPEATWLPLSYGSKKNTQSIVQEVRQFLEKTDALLLGPGLGMAAPAQELVSQLITPELPPFVVDADGLKLLAQLERWSERLPVESVLTPHPGEMSILTHVDKSTIQADRVQVAERFAHEWGHIVVLKGPFTVVAAPDGRTGILPMASPALARAGTGDVLAGIITGLRAQGMGAFEAALAGVWLHAKAGMHAAKSKGSTASVLAGDLIDELGPLLK